MSVCCNCTVPGELAHVAQAVEVLEVDVRHVAAAQLLAQRGHAGAGAARTVVPADYQLDILID